MLNADPAHRFTAPEAKAAGCDHKDVLWAAGMLARDNEAVARRLTGYVNDCAIRMLPSFEARWPDDSRPREAILATIGFVIDSVDLAAWLHAATTGQRAWAAWAAPDAWATEFLWIQAVDHRSLDRAKSTEWNGWEKWAEWVCWTVEAARLVEARKAELRRDSYDDVGWIEEFDAWHFDRLIHWLSSDSPKPLPVPPAPFGHARKEGALHLDVPSGAVSIDEISLGWSDVLALPERLEIIDTIDLSRNATFAVPDGVKSIGRIGLSDHPDLELPNGVETISLISLHNSTIYVPKSVYMIERVDLSCESELVAHGITGIGDIRLSDFSNLRLPIGLAKVGDIRLEYCDLALPDSVRSTGDIKIEAPEDEDGEFTLDLGAGVVALGNVVIGDHMKLIIPSNVQEIGDVVVQKNARLYLPTGLSPKSVSLDEGAIITRY